MQKPEIGILHRWYYQNVVDIVDTGGSNLSVVPEKDLEKQVDDLFDYLRVAIPSLLATTLFAARFQSLDVSRSIDLIRCLEIEGSTRCKFTKDLRIVARNLRARDNLSNHMN